MWTPLRQKKEENNNKGSDRGWANASTHNLLQHECQIFIGSKISLSFYFNFSFPLWVQITLGSKSKSLKILQIPAAPLPSMPAAGWCSLWCVKLLKGQEDTRISTLAHIRNTLTSSDRWLLTDGEEGFLFSGCFSPLGLLLAPVCSPSLFPKYCTGCSPGGDIRAN